VTAPAALLERLLAGDDLDAPGARALLDALIGGELDPTVSAALLVALRGKGETATEVAAFVEAMRAAAVPLTLDADVRARAVDTCGTGGDGAGTINVSTVAAVVTAAAGVPVVKHGNRAASSRSGSADLLEAWGVALELGPDAARRVLDATGVTFLYARHYHPAMRHVAPVRSALGVRTVFNLLGPLSNPAAVVRQVVGVPDPHVGELVAGALARLGHTHALVVHGDDGLDELTTTTTSRTWEVRDGHVTAGTVDPAALGLPTASRADLQGGDVDENRRHADAILDGAPGAHADLVALNAAAALLVGGAVDDLAGGVELARGLLADGTARAVRDAWVAASQRAAADA